MRKIVLLLVCILILTLPAYALDTIESKNIIVPVTKPIIKLSAKPTGTLNIKCKWNKVEGAKTYKVYKWSQKKKKYVRIKTTTSNKFIYKQRPLNKRYKLKVTAFNARGKKLCVSKRVKVKNTLKYKTNLGKFDCTAYHCGTTTSTGKHVKVGYVAVDPRVIPYHSKLYVVGYGFCYAEDCGGAIKGNRLDLYMSSVSKCYQWGHRYKTVYVIRWGK